MAQKPPWGLADLELKAVESLFNLWQLAVDCGGTGADANPVVSGWLSRAPLASTPSGTPSQRASFYAENGIWQDAVSALSLARHPNPSQSQLNSDWRSLLETAGLTQFSTQPVVAGGASGALMRGAGRVFGLSSRAGIGLGLFFWGGGWSKGVLRAVFPTGWETFGKFPPLLG